MSGYEFNEANEQSTKPMYKQGYSCLYVFCVSPFWQHDEGFGQSSVVFGHCDKMCICCREIRVSVTWMFLEKGSDHYTAIWNK